MAAGSLPLIDIDRLQLGMYIVLDVGWRNHPFLRGSFTIRTDEQLSQLRTLGLQQVRWCPERSTAGPLPESALDPALQPIDELPDLPDSIDAAPMPESPATAPAGLIWSAAEPATELQWQEASLQRVEDEYRYVSQRHGHLLRQLQTDPAAAREAAEELGETVHRSVVDSHDPTVRLLSDRVGQQTSGHDIAVTALALLLARDCGFSPAELREVALAALLHDVGKLRLPRFLHEDSRRLTDFERRSYRRHVELGVDLAKAIGLSAAVVRAIAEHHERCDGSGFPAALEREQITPASRVIAIANRYQNLLCPLQQVHSGLTPYQALQQMYGVERAHFDPEYLARFVRIMGVYPPGTLVELTDQRMAVVIASRPGASLSPRVQIIDTPDDNAPTTAIDIDGEGELRVRCSVHPAQLNPKWAQRSRQLARTPIYIEPQSAPEWSAWGATEMAETAVF